MGTLDSGGDNVIELDDSGCVQDDASPSTMSSESRRVSLLDLSDDVLLEVLKYCEPRDLKALGFSCPRLGTLIQDRTLWNVVEERSHPVSKARLCWYLHNVLDEGTKSLLLTGYAREAARCLVHQTRQNSSAPLNLVVTPDMATSATQTDEEVSDNAQPSTSAGSTLGHPITCSHCKPGHSASSPPPMFSSPRRSPCQACPPQFTLNGQLMHRLSAQCTRLERLTLEYCNIDCNQTKLSQFPRSLKYLSLRGSKCYNLPIDKSFMFQVNDYLPNLEEVDVSDCSWLEGCVLLPLSKLTKLYKLSAHHCRKLSEFIAYASLAARYGFRALKVLDVRGSPLRDSEVSAFSWCPSLEELYLAACRGEEGEGEVPEHVHYKGEELAAWETESPEYFNDAKVVEEEITKEVQTVSPPYLAWANGATQNTAIDEPGITNVLTITLNQNRNVNTINISAENLPRPVNQNGEQNQDGGPSGNSQNGEDNQNGGANAGDNQNGDRQKNGIDMTTQKKQEHSNQDEAGPSNVQNGAETQNEKLTDQLKGTKRAADDSSSDEEDSIPRKASKMADNESSTSNDNGSQKSTQKFVRFRRNQPPVVVNQENVGQNIRPLIQEQSGMPLNLANVDRTRTEQNFARLLNQLEQNANQANVAAENDEPNPRVVERPNWVHNQNNLPRDEPAIRVVNEMEPRLESDPEGRYHVLYVNVGRQMHAEYEVSLEHERPICRQIPPFGQQIPRMGPPNDDMNRWDNYRRQLRSIYWQMRMASGDVDSSSYVTDNALQRFGSQEVANVVQRGPRGEIFINAPRDNGKPKQSKLKVLVCTGYRLVTNASLVHLAVTAPDLRFVDLTGTNVTAQGVENFKMLRPDCEVKFGGSKSVDS